MLKLCCVAISENGPWLGCVCLLLQLCRVATFEDVAGGKVLWEAGEPAEKLYLVMSGTVALWDRQPGGNSLTASRAGGWLLVPVYKMICFKIC